MVVPSPDRLSFTLILRSCLARLSIGLLKDCTTYLSMIDITVSYKLEIYGGTYPYSLASFAAFQLNNYLLERPRYDDPIIR